MTSSRRTAPIKTYRFLPQSSSAFCLSILFAHLVAGCTGTGLSRGSRDGINALHLFGLPVAVNLDGEPGVDGIGLRVYAGSAGTARGVPIHDGVFEVLLFDGPVSSAQPIKIWTLPASVLRSFESETSLGIGYQLALRWDTHRPKGNSATVIARYRSPSGKVINSAPNAISLGGR